MNAAVFDAWAALDFIQRGHPPAKVANPANPIPSEPAGLASLATLAGGQGPDLKMQASIAFLVRAAEDAFDALQTPDPDLDAERAVMAGGSVQTTDHPCTNLPKVA